MTVGRVFLVGAGPGDPGLLTIRGRDALRAADVVVYDRLVNPALLDEAPSGALRVFAGKRRGEACVTQGRIHHLLVWHARRGRTLVRLKGGDPFVFGRGGEEAECLADAGIPFEVVPGVSSAVAAPAYAGIPLTHRELSSSLAVVTGHGADGSERVPVDWSRLATAVDTLVVLMGVETLASTVAQVTAHGRPPGTPVALIRWGTTDAQQVIVGTLADIVDRAERVHLAPPVVAVIGDVVSLRARLDWFGAGDAADRGDDVEEAAAGIAQVAVGATGGQRRRPAQRVASRRPAKAAGSDPDGQMCGRPARLSAPPAAARTARRAS